MYEAKDTHNPGHRRESQYEMIMEGDSRVYTDPSTAHGAGDRDWTRNITTCVSCLVKRKALEAAGLEVPKENETW